MTASPNKNNIIQVILKLITMEIFGQIMMKTVMALLIVIILAKSILEVFDELAAIN